MPTIVPVFVVREPKSTVMRAPQKIVISLVCAKKPGADAVNWTWRGLLPVEGLMLGISKRPSASVNAHGVRGAEI